MANYSTSSPTITSFIISLIIIIGIHTIARSSQVRYCNSTLLKKLSSILYCCMYYLQYVFVESSKVLVCVFLERFHRFHSQLVFFLCRERYDRCIFFSLIWSHIFIRYPASNLINNPRGDVSDFVCFCSQGIVIHKMFCFGNKLILKALWV